MELSYDLKDYIMGDILMSEYGNNVKLKEIKTDKIDRKILIHILKNINICVIKIEYNIIKNIYEWIKLICEKNNKCIDYIDDTNKNVLFYVINLYYSDIITSTIELFKTHSSNFDKLLNHEDYIGETCFMKSGAFTYFKEYDINIDLIFTKGYMSNLFKNIYCEKNGKSTHITVNIELTHDTYTYREIINLLYDNLKDIEKNDDKLYYRTTILEKHTVQELIFIHQYIDENMTIRAKSAYKR